MTQALILLHIIFGSIALIAGTLNILRPKSGKSHKNIGLLFTCSMCLTAILSIIVSTIKGLDFLLLIGVFSLYLTLSGYLYKKPQVTDNAIRAVSIGMIISGVFMMTYGSKLLYKGQAFGMAPIVFSAIGIGMSLMDIYRPVSGFNNKTRRHLQRMTGAYISALTAFLVVNIKASSFLPGVIFWILPTVLITPLIIKWSGKY